MMDGEVAEEFVRRRIWEGGMWRLGWERRKEEIRWASETE
jgi:hypothetical protein